MWFLHPQIKQTEREIIAKSCTDVVTKLVDSFIANSPDLSAERAADCRSTVDEVAAAIMQSGAEQMARIDRKIADTFSIPAHVVLPEHMLQAHHAKTRGADEEQRLEAELLQLQQQFDQQAQFITAMAAELEVHRKLVDGQNTELAMMELLEQSLIESSTSTEECRNAVAELKRALDVDIDDENA